MDINRMVKNPLHSGTNKNEDPDPITIIIAIISSISGLGSLVRGLRVDAKQRRIEKVRQTTIRLRTRACIESIESDLQEIKSQVSNLHTLYESGEVDTEKAPFKIGGAGLDLTKPEEKRFFKILRDTQKCQIELNQKFAKLGSFVQNISPLDSHEVEGIEDFKEDMFEMVDEFNRSVFAIEAPKELASDIGLYKSQRQVIGAIESVIEKTKRSVKSLRRVFSDNELG